MSPDEALCKLQSYTSSGVPFVSLYLNVKPRRDGKIEFDRIKEEAEFYLKRFSGDTFSQACLEFDLGKIVYCLQSNLKPETKSVAIFACAGDNGFFVPLEFTRPITRNQLSVGEMPCLYQLAALCQTEELAGEQLEVIAGSVTC